MFLNKFAILFFSLRVVHEHLIIINMQYYYSKQSSLDRSKGGYLYLHHFLFLLPRNPWRLSSHFLFQYWQYFGWQVRHQFIQGKNFNSRFNLSWNCYGGVSGFLPLDPWAASSLPLSFIPSQIFHFIRRLPRLHFNNYVLQDSEIRSIEL